MTFLGWQYSHRTMVRSGRRAAMSGVAAGVLAGLVLAAAPTVARAGVAEGKDLYEKQCKVCHSLAGVGGKMAKTGGPLDGVGTKRTAEWIKAYLLDPKSQIPNAKMPKMKLSPAEIDDSVAYMMSLK